ncbi:ribonuclease P [Azotobacter vinelandii CA]|uniref:Ribonuclease P protein component n=2 Tax=Azotobacter vinelandii TaxID=354 RepID=RNPA_AZOVD|nr:ribonuclease P protein component [Azotobacter vinelandii]C1DNF9.1 RecName: Full=Ribonuclease P protein component; Short=RNase P protein; Short=RNaseP protein; AltName: Full=Protein C5 [Azotobacter vinelandii DJ]ACO81317.1 Bacterial ribonuclease P protein [Azotobacter vinelandii DJ]AGK13075.1 ribonuclease P [Azotobacter vinelandii CA]AGK18698.1 ribonuclease P [Azotobacter vinelandii CA6]WKN22053.1 ribonuclease P protein component [Azotobacter vinelandii]SFX29273.1 ribonuclease P protein com
MVSRDFGREKRLLIPRQFKAVFDSPTAKVPGKHVLLLARPNALDHPRLGLVIGKKSVKLSVGRNRLKRLIRESFRLNQDSLAGWDIVVVARKGLGELENTEVTQQFGKLWKRLARSRPQTAVEAAGSSHA